MLNILKKVKDIILSAELLKNMRDYWTDFKKSQLIYRDLFENAIDGMYISKLDGQYVEVNNSLVKILGYASRKQLLKVNTKNLYFNREDRPDFNDRNRVFGTCLKKMDGSKIYVEISSRVLYRNGRPVYYEGIVRDKTEYKKYEEKIKYLSFHDALTGLYNWAYFNEEIKRLRKTRRLPVTIIMGDVDRLKYVNDTFGHSRGNHLLKKIADIMSDNFRGTDVISRTGGDEFCIILPDTPKEEAENIILRIKEKCIIRSSKKMPISISFGIAEKNNADMEIKKVLEYAEKSMYKNKYAGKLSRR
jgi:diguanylate cyclase (GGDEF)-like protein/PAS domain S-box-containing protein